MAKKKAKAKPRKSKKIVRKVKKVRKAAKPKRTAKKAVKGKKKAVRKQNAALLDPSLEKIGEVTHYFPHVQAAAVKVTKNSLRIGDTISIKGHTTDFNEQVASIQLDHAPVAEGKRGMEIGLRVAQRVRIGDTVYRIRA